MTNQCCESTGAGPDPASVESAPLTHHAPPERETEFVLASQRALVTGSPNLTAVLDAVPQATFILNDKRQIIGANRSAVSLLGAASVESLIGLRPGEALACSYAAEAPNGCGTGRRCQACGAVNAILRSAEERRVVQEECHLSRDLAEREALDLLVTASPLELDSSQRLTIVALENISSHRRRQALERIFLHDMMNSLSGVKGLLEDLSESADPTELAESVAFLTHVTRGMVMELQDFRSLTLAEEGELEVKWSRVDSLAAVEEAIQQMKSHSVAKRLTIARRPESQSGELTTDPALLRRVLINMIKNACEASNPGETVSACCRPVHEAIQFSVHNVSVMPEQVKLQIFQRSFSTKGTGRGLGTYSMKLLTTRYLKGEISFTSEPGEGTTFRLVLPTKPRGQ